MNSAAAPVAIADRSAAREQFFTVETLGPKQSLTPEGYLLCEEVPIARTGPMLYGLNEGTTVKPGPYPYIIIDRDAAEVFRAEFVRSFEGKPFLLNHPPEKLVTAESWRRHARGHVINPRQGEGQLSEFLVADLLVTDPECIGLIQSKEMTEVSAGYTAEFETIEPGKGRQFNMLGNHVALVKSARCGAACAIQDHAQGDHMKRIPVADEASLEVRRESALSKIAAAVIAAFKKGGIVVDEKMVRDSILGVVDEMVSMPGGGSPHEIAINLNSAVRDEALAGEVGELKKNLSAFGDTLTGFRKTVDGLMAHTGYKIGDADESDDDKKKREEAEAAKKATDADAAETAKRIGEETGSATTDAASITDSALLSGAHQEAASGAEILMPGITILPFDAKAKPKATLDSICKMRRTALDMAYNTPEGKKIIDGLTGGKKPDFARLDCAAERLMFRAAVSARKAVKDSGDAARAAAAEASERARKEAGNKVVRTAAEMNNRNKDFWAKATTARP